MSPLVFLVLISAFASANRYGFPSETITMYKDQVHPARREPMVIDSRQNAQNPWSAIQDVDSSPHRTKRSIVKNDNINTRISHLNSSHSLLVVHWVGKGSDVILCLARDSTQAQGSGSNSTALYISYDYGDSFQDKTKLLLINNNKLPIIEKFYNHHKFNKHVVLTDIVNKVLFTTTDSGKSFSQTSVDFSPSEVLLDEDDPFTFLVYDKIDPMKKLYVTSDFGKTFTLLQESVKSFHWAAGVPLDDDDFDVDDADESDDASQDVPKWDTRTLFVERLEPSGTSTVLASNTLFQRKSYKVLIRDVLDFHIKGDFMFASKMLGKGETRDLELYVSYKRQPFQRALFQSELSRLRYHIADVSDSQAMVAVIHDSQLTNLYVSVDPQSAKFALSLENIFCYMPNITWKNSWLNTVTEPFTTLTKVEGLRGIYIASVVSSKSKNGHIGPENLSTMITFDQGGEWKLITPPQYDDEQHPYKCRVEAGCSLHLAQSFTHLFPMTRSVSILTSKSAPGIILATGVVGRSLKGRPGVFLSTDAGVTWRQILKDVYFYNFGDHGGVMVAVKYYKSRGETRQILYSTDEWLSYKQHEFTEDDLRMYGLMTEPGGNTTVFTMFGSATEKHQWIIVKVDMKNAFDYNCTEEDYKFWSPGSGSSGVHVPCILGRTETYQRRLPHTKCYSSRDFVRRVKMEVCRCSVEDFDCDYGFKRKLVQQTQCIRNRNEELDPYAVPKICPPGSFYNRSKGYRKIPGDVCVEGDEDRYLPDKLPCPFREEEEFLLVAQREHIARITLGSNKLELLPILGLKNVIAIEYDMRSNCVYWSDVYNDTIGRQCLTTGTDMPQVLVHKNLSSIEGLAFDWVSNLLYFVDGARKTIEVIRTDVTDFGRMRRTILGSDVLSKPRGIAVHPKAGYMFWSDWSPNASISRANLDGSNVKRLIGSNDLKWPNGVAVDYIAERLYWVDAREDYIGSCTLDGKNFLKIISNNVHVSHPFGVAVFKDNMYWDDWKGNAVFVADKDHGLAVQNITKPLYTLMDLKIYAHSIQEGTNACSNKSLCTHICVGAPNGGYTCLCPDELQMVNGECLCPGGKPLQNGTCPQVAATCDAKFFTCGNGSCVPWAWKCDGQFDCADRSDEKDCPKSSSTCPPKQFRCTDGSCISVAWRCDKDRDCPDGSDETCNENCTADEFKCNTGHCIPKKWVCDGERDCHDSSDEMNCKLNVKNNTTCRVGEFKCENNSNCVPKSWLCDGEPDCLDNSDEKNCTQQTCDPVTQFTCEKGPHRCIFQVWRCDGTDDCEDGSDEKDCDTISVSPLPPSIVPQKNETCADWMFMCNNKQCIPGWWKCDSVNDCGDGSDEMGCGESDGDSSEDSRDRHTTPNPFNHPRCPENFFQCLSGRCIPDAWVCDRSPECEHGEDEFNCNNGTTCRQNQFMCRTDGSCVSLSSVCDGIRQCPDGSDEASCQPDGDSPKLPKCKEGTFACPDGRCYPMSQYCDGRLDCMDGSDESNCSQNGTKVYQVLQLGVDKRYQVSTSLNLYWWVQSGVHFEYLPSICEVAPLSQRAPRWRNHTAWIENPEFQFTNLSAFTTYNMTVYVRVKGSDHIFPPGKYIVANTTEGVPSEPWKVKATQLNATTVSVDWEAPLQPRGIIIEYLIYMTPPLPPYEYNVYMIGSGDHNTRMMIKYEFEPNVTYSFWVVARNSRAKSNYSEITTLEFDENSVVGQVSKLNARDLTNNSITLTWNSVKGAEKYEIYVRLPQFYPEMEKMSTTNQDHFTVSGLPPALSFQFEVKAIKGKYSGEGQVYFAKTLGDPLPQVEGINVMQPVNSSQVNVTWSVPRDTRTKNWTYGVYYDLTLSDMLRKPKIITNSTSVLVTDLQPCESYLFAVGLLGPFGYGPISFLPSRRKISTLPNQRAAPKHVKALRHPNDFGYMVVEWQPSCLLDSRNTTYIVNVMEVNLNRTSMVKLLPTSLSHVQTYFRVRNGGVYNVTVQTNEQGALVSAPVTYEAPPIPAPHQLKVEPQNNGSYILYWNCKQSPALPEDLLKSVSYEYEVLVSEGRTLEESKAKSFVVPGSPFTLSNVQEGTVYSFALRLRTSDGYVSQLSEVRSIEVPIGSWTAAVKSGVLYYSLLPGLVLVILLLSTLGYFVMRHRRLQHSFATFANSHYDTRSGAATLGGPDGLVGDFMEEEDSPVIRGFSDDEPLVIA